MKGLEPDELKVLKHCIDLIKKDKIPVYISVDYAYIDIEKEDSLYEKFDALTPSEDLGRQYYNIKVWLVENNLSNEIDIVYEKEFRYFLPYYKHDYFKQTGNIAQTALIECSIKLVWRNK